MSRFDVARMFPVRDKVVCALDRVKDVLDTIKDETLIALDTERKLEYAENVLSVAVPMLEHALEILNIECDKASYRL